MVLERARPGDYGPTGATPVKQAAVLRGRYRFADDGRRLFAVRLRAAAGGAQRYDLVLRTWDATPLYDLRDVLAGTVQPANHRERLRVIALCKWQHRYATAARFYRDAFAADPSLADDVTAGHRYDAACCQLWAAAGQGSDAGPLDEPARTRLRQQALAWLQADLGRWRKHLDDLRARHQALETLRQWQNSPDLAAVRQPDAIAKLPADAQQACRQLWAGVAALLKSDEHYQRAIRLEADQQRPAAIAAYRKAIANNPSSGQAYWRLAMALDAGDDWHGAAAAYRKVVELYPAAQNYARLDVALQAAQQPAEADSAYRKAVELNRTMAAQVYLQVGTALYARQRHDAALAALRRTVATSPHNAQAYRLLGLAHFAKAQWDEAIAAWRKMQVGPQESEWISYNIGRAFEHKRQWDDAITEFQRVIEINPRHADAHNGLGFALQQKDDFDGAIAEYRKAIAINSRLPNPHNNLGIALRRKGDLGAAVAEHRRAIAINPAFAAAHDQLGWSLRLQGKLDEALTACRRAVALQPRVANYHNSLGCVLRDLGKTADSIAALRQAIALEPRFADAHGNLGVALSEARDWDGAIAAYRKAIEFEPAHLDALLNLPEVLLRRGRLAEARAVAQQAVRARRNDAEIARRAALYDRLAALEPRLPDLLAGRKQAANNAERLDLALLCRLQDRYATAARFYREAFAAKPGLADERNNWHRYNAACYAALAGTGAGIDSAKTDDAERARLRQQSLDWLRAELTLWKKLRADGTPQDRQQLAHWQRDPDLRGVRGAAIDRLPRAEQASWRQLWSDVAQALNKTGATGK